MINKGIGALIHQKWEKGNHPGEIIGFWAEDGNAYTIKMPPQLVEIMLLTQNWLNDKYETMNQLKNKASSIEYFFKKEINND